MVNGERQGLWKEYHEDATLRAIGLMLKGQRHGRWNLYYRNGQILRVYDFIYVEGSRFGVLDGLDTTYYSNGNKESEGTWKNGKKNGSSREYYENEILKMDCFYVDDDLDGFIDHWHPNGRLAYRIRSSKGLRDGLEQHFDQTGMQVAELKWEDGVLVSYSNF